MNKEQKEKWVDVSDEFWAKYFQVSSYGNFRSKDTIDNAGRVIRGKRIETKGKRHGKLIAALRKRVDGKELRKILYIGKEVATAFISKPEPIIIEGEDLMGYYRNVYPYNYIENISGNLNNNHVWNLRWMHRNDLHTLPWDFQYSGSMEIWKDMHNPFWGAMFEISSFGRIRSKDRMQLKRNNTCVKPYEQHYESRLILLRTNNIDSSLFATLMYTDIFGVRTSKSAYVAKEVALVFLPKPPRMFNKKTRRYYDYMYVENRDGNYHDNSVANIRWITHYELHLKQVKLGKKINMELYKHSPIWQNRKKK
jgi:hypothetical protein